MSFDPPPSAEDVDLEDYGAYSRRELVMARATLLRTMKESQSAVWQRLKYKMGLLPDGRRLRPDGPEHMWIPSELPPLWSAPVALHDPQAQLSVDQVQQPEADVSLRGKIPWGAGAIGHSSKNPGSRSESVASSSSTSFVPITVSSDSGEENGGHRGSLRKETIIVSDSEGSDFKFKVGQAGAGSSASTSDPQEKAFSQTKMYDVMYRCDLCSILLQDEQSMALHLQLKGHHSASRYLGFVDPSSVELRPKFVCVVSALKDERYLFRYKIPTCPLCHEFFTDLRQCVDHCAASHQAPGMYSLRSVCQLETVKLKRRTNKCLVCNKTFNEHSLRVHIAQTQHMVEPNLMIFPCDFCDRVHSDIITHKRHLLSEHEEKTGIKKTIPVLCVTVRTAQPPMQLLPPNPGIPAARISGDASELHAPPKTVCADNNYQGKRYRGAKKVINLVMRRFQSARGKPIVKVLSDEEKARRKAKADRKKARRIALQKKKAERHSLRNTSRQDSGLHSQGQ
ncbi:uncharacterized protein [Littorina saxatilis]|uniref:uncharacterized protein n=1 Tax=Littorina saxatilis TaxID=31220 RepID=UPI0038B5350B